MKRKIIGTILTLVACVSFVQALDKGLQVAYIDLEKIFSSQVISSKFDSLKSEFDKRHDEFQAAQDKLEAMVAEHEIESPLMTKIVKDNREQELKDMAHKLSKQGAEMTQEYYGRQQELKSNYLKQASDISERLAKKHEISVVMARHNLLFADPSLDLTDELLLEFK